MLKNIILLRCNHVLAFFICFSMGICYAESRKAFQIEGVPHDLPILGVELNKENITLRYYISKSNKNVESMIIFVPGSGCDGAFYKAPGEPAHAGMEIFALPYASMTRLLIIEPPGISRQYSSFEHGLGENCPEEYYDNSDFNSMLNYYKTVVYDALQQSKSVKRVMFIGASDGAPFSAALAALVPKTTMLTLISGFSTGHIQQILHDDVQVAMADDEQITRTKKFKSLIGKWETILKNPNSTKYFMGGHPYTRWSSTALVSSSSLAASLPKEVVLYVVQGGQDKPAMIGFIAGVADLISRKRAFSFEIIACAGHTLICEEDLNPVDHLEKTLKTSIEWFLNGEIPSSNESIVHFSP